jgi:hypothetical protein
MFPTGNVSQPLHALRRLSLENRSGSMEKRRIPVVLNAFYVTVCNDRSYCLRHSFWRRFVDNKPETKPPYLLLPFIPEPN